MNIICLDTPSLLIDSDVMIANLLRMSNLCQNASIKLRPHIKTHKIGEVALKQVELMFSSVEKLPLFHLKMFQLDVNGFQPFFGFFEPVRFTAHVNNIRFMS